MKPLCERAILRELVVTEAEDMASTNIVNLDALIQRADLAAPGEASEDIVALSVSQLGPKGLLYPALRKPDFQRETASWSPEAGG